MTDITFPLDDPRRLRPWLGPRGWLRRLRGRVWRLRVVDLAPVTERMLRLSFASDDLGDFAWIPGQDLVLELPQANGAPARRHYTIRSFDPVTRRIEADIVLHGGGACALWLDGLRMGDALLAVGPRGHTRLNRDPAVDRHLFFGDESAIPAIYAMAEALPSGARAQVVIEAEDEADVQPLTTRAEVTVDWRFRHGRPAGERFLLLDRLEALAPSPHGAHAYVLGETSQVRAVRRELLIRGFEKARITAEGYWRPGRAGGHDHV